MKVKKHPPETALLLISGDLVFWEKLWNLVVCK